MESFSYEGATLSSSSSSLLDRIQKAGPLFDADGRLIIAKNDYNMGEMGKLLLKRDELDRKEAFNENMFSFLACVSLNSLRDLQSRKNDALYQAVVDLFDEVSDVVFFSFCDFTSAFV
jgi:hypothetical protein